MTVDRHRECSLRSVAGASLTDVPIRARRPRFDLSETPLHWIPGDPVATSPPVRRPSVVASA